MRLENRLRNERDKRRISGIVIVASAISALFVQTPQASAAGQVAQLGRSHTFGDFDGDGLLDRAFGFPGVDDGRGSVVVVYGDGAIEEINRGTPGILEPHSADDYFGDSLSAGDIDRDGRDDLVVGVPGDDVSVWGLGGPITTENAGSIHVIYGDDDGLTSVGDQVIDRDSTGIDEGVGAYDRFGEAVVVGDFDCDTFQDVAVGVPFDDAHPGRTNDGSIHVIYGTFSGLSSADDYFHQGTPDVSGAPETNDEFGASLAVGNFNGDFVNGNECLDLAVGVVGENNDGGYLAFFYGDPFERFSFSFANRTGLSQNMTADQLEAGDAFGAQMWAFNDNGDAFDDLMVGVPGETCGDGREAGYHSFRGHTNGFVTGSSLNNGVNSLVCMDWPDLAVQDAIAEYRRCMDFSEEGCGQRLTSDFLALDRGSDVEYATACEAGIEFALDACEHWITDPLCDVDLCIAAAHELSSIALGCEHEGDVITNAYP